MIRHDWGSSEVVDQIGGPIKDLGFLKAISINYNKSLPLNKKFLDKLKKKWDPWCSVATWYLWRSIDPIPVNY